MLTLNYRCAISLRSLPLRVQQVLYFCDDTSGKDDKNAKREVKKKDTEAPKSSQPTSALNELLTSMKTDDRITRTKTIEMAKPGGKKRQKEKKKQEIIDEKGKESEDILKAVKAVADVMGANKEQTESELLSKLLHHIDSTGHTKETSEEPAKDLNDVIIGMKVDQTKQRQSKESRGQYVRAALKNVQFRDTQQRRQRRLNLDDSASSSQQSSVNLFDPKNALGIFKNPDKLTPTPDNLKSWELFQKRELNLSVTHPPANYFEKVVLWTEQGKLWKFPINNEQGLDEEAKVDFSDHVFVDQHLEGWCPEKGPIRHFMELVCVGLSKNFYFTAQEKKEHILWYRDYFESKKDILREVIAKQEDVKPKQIEK